MTAETHPEQIPDIDWAHRPEPYLVPVPADRVDPLVGRRVALSDPQALCWRYDVVVIHVVDDDDLGPAAAVIDEFDLHRGNRDGGKIPTARVALRHLWVEELYEDADAIPLELRQPAVEIPPRQDHLREDAIRIDPTRPPIRRARQGNRVSGNTTIGARVMLNTPSGFMRGLRLVSQPHLWKHPGPNIFGDVDNLDVPRYLQCYTICDEEDYYGWAATGVTPQSCRYVQCGQVFFE